MIAKELIWPNSIVVIGASNNTSKPGGKLLKNLIDNRYKGDLMVVNPGNGQVQNTPTYSSVNDLPPVELAVLAIPAKACLPAIEILAREKGTKGFIIISAGFSEEGEEGKMLETQIVKVIEENGGSLIGPNCIGIITYVHASVFTTPVPKLDQMGCDFISSSGATAVFIMESGIPKGLHFASVFSVGNSAQIGVEDVLEFMDEVFDPETSTRVKLLYIESIKNPDKLLKHASSLIRKGCKIAAIKAGSSDAGSRAASSHTGAMANSDSAVEALFRKAGIVRCYGREELTTVANVFMCRELKGKQMAIITHAGGPAVMLTDSLSGGGLQVPPIKGPAAESLLKKMHPGSSAANPIDVLATGGVEQMEAAIECVDKELDFIDGMCIIFGSPGLSSVESIYSLIDEKMKSCKKPIYPILPSVINAREEINSFLAKGRINFPDEVVFAEALVKERKSRIYPDNAHDFDDSVTEKLRKLFQEFPEGYLAPEQVQQLLDTAGISRIPEKVVTSFEEAVSTALSFGFPVVMKVVGPIHKTDVGGVLLNLSNYEEVEDAFDTLMGIPEATGVLIQPMLRGRELFVGASREGSFGHVVMIGLGGIFIEVLKDVQSGLAPLGEEEVRDMIGNLKGKKLLEGVRGQAGIDIAKWIQLIRAVSNLVTAVPEIAEMDLNPVMGLSDRVVAVDARIRIEKM